MVSRAEALYQGPLAPCKRTQHCWPTLTPNIVGCCMLRPLTQHCWPTLTPNIGLPTLLGVACCVRLHTVCWGRVVPLGEHYISLPVIYSVVLPIVFCAKSIVIFVCSIVLLANPGGRSVRYDKTRLLGLETGQIFEPTTSNICFVP